ncbi:MAG TPA: PQQ-dependent sugar dehydrogenase, partial [Abditibacteriaceae bacterium]|nr:PQQ-dependent sugar dehydrogenase [Abditibacteriaceae bacterium]
MRMAKMVLCALLGLLNLVAPAPAQTWPQIALSTPISGFTYPVHITHAGDNRLFVAEVGGHIRVVQNGVLLATPFLDISALQRQGLFSVAFAPNYATSGQFYVNYVDQALNVVVARYQVSGDPTTSNVADPNSAQIILRVPSP